MLFGKTMDYKSETIVRLREKLGREPTEAEIEAERERSIKRAYADMALTAWCFKDDELPNSTS
jgi:hypothetical protein